MTVEETVAAEAGKTLDELIAMGAPPEGIVAVVRLRGERDNLAAQAGLASPGALTAADRTAWAGRLLDGQPIHGEVKGPLWAAGDALRAGNDAGILAADGPDL